MRYIKCVIVSTTVLKWKTRSLNVPVEIERKLELWRWKVIVYLLAWGEHFAELAFVQVGIQGKGFNMLSYNAQIVVLLNSEKNDIQGSMGVSYLFSK